MKDVVEVIIPELCSDFIFFLSVLWTLYMLRQRRLQAIENCANLIFRFSPMPPRLAPANLFAIKML